MEERTLFAWVEAEDANRKFFEDMARIWRLSEEEEFSHFDINIEDAWNKVDAATISDQANTTKRVFIRSTFMRWSVAALILVLFAAFIWFVVKPSTTNDFIVINTGQGERMEITLPDSSRVWLNADSELRYPADFKKRQLELFGEAFFEVVHDEIKPFLISAGEVTVTVLGTSFNVRAYKTERDVAVSVQTGRVSVSAGSKVSQEEIVEMGTTAIVDKEKNEIQISEEALPAVEAWKTGRLIFNDTQMKDVLNILERYFGVSMNASNPAILNCHFRATFDNPDISSVIEVLSETFALKVNVTGNVYQFSGAGCSSID